MIISIKLDEICNRTEWFLILDFYGKPVRLDRLGYIRSEIKLQLNGIIELHGLSIFRACKRLTSHELDVVNNSSSSRFY